MCGLDATRAPFYLFIIAPGFQAGISGQHFPKRIAALKGRAFKGFHGTATIFILRLARKMVDDTSTKRRKGTEKDFTRKHDADFL